MIELREVSIRRAQNVLLENANLRIYAGQKIGLVGYNGCGKSSLLALLLEGEEPAQGSVSLPTGLKISYLAQHTPSGAQSALDFVLSGDSAYWEVIQRLEKAEAQEDHTVSAACHDALLMMHGYAKPAEAASILDGLGFSPETIYHAVDTFSGGWRMRLSLARCLMQPHDFLLLDEPTNHLDLEAVSWLERWLQQSSATILVVAHDRDFLDAFTTHIVHIAQKRLTVYTGNYSQFENARIEQMALQQATYEKQQQVVAHMEDFIRRFKAKASKAKQAQSRVKALERMELVAKAEVDTPFQFSFPSASAIRPPYIRCEQVVAGYTANHPILNHIDFSLDPGARIGLLGPNGQGKSTFLKTLLGELPPLDGQVIRTAGLILGYFDQHQGDILAGDQTPLQLWQSFDGKVSDQAIRDYLGRFDFSGDKVSQVIHTFSGGERARLALAKLVWQKPHVLLLDEPTNHFDMSMRQSLAMALQTFSGAIILISHDRFLLRTVVDTFYRVHNGEVQPFDGDLDSYQRLMSKSNSVPKTAPVKKSLVSGKTQKLSQQKCKKLERRLEHIASRLEEIDQILAQEHVYQAEEREHWEALLIEQQSLLAEQASLEQEWLEMME